MSRTSFRGRTLARSQAVQMLYQAEFTGRSVREVLSGEYVISGVFPGEYAISGVIAGRENSTEDPDDGRIWVWEQWPQSSSCRGSKGDAGDYVRVRLRRGKDKGTLIVRPKSFRILVWDSLRDGYVMALFRKGEPLILDVGPRECGISDDHSGRYLIDNAAGLVDGYAKELALGTSEIVGCLDHILNASSPNWGVSRMPSLDRNLLRLALFEMLEVDTVDISVAIDECVELAKSYGTDESSRFVNGLLGTIASQIKAGVDVLGLAREELDRKAAEAVEGDEGVGPRGDEPAGDASDDAISLVGAPLSVLASASPDSLGSQGGS